MNSAPSPTPVSALKNPPSNDARPLLRVGGAVLLLGLLAAVYSLKLLRLLLIGASLTGVNHNAEWLALVFALLLAPSGLLLFLLGAAKSLGRRR